MKMILVAAAALMTGASVYGLIDYNKRSGSPEFENLYRGDKTARSQEVPATANQRELKSTVTDENVKVALKKEKPVKKLPKKKRKLSYKEFSRAAPEEVIIEKDVQ